MVVALIFPQTLLMRWLCPVAFCLSLQPMPGLSPGHLRIPFFFTPLDLDLLLVHGHMVVPTGGLMDQWLWISRTHPVEWLFTGDGLVLEMDGSAKLSSG